MLLRFMLKAVFAGVLTVASGMGSIAMAAKPYITVASTTSTQNSGLFDHLLPAFTDQTGISVRVVAVGTGKAIKMAQSGDADVLLVHHRRSEEKFVADGYGLERYNVMYNDFVIVGPKQDPAGAATAGGVDEALAAIAAQNRPFASRGDDSGTHKKELALWRNAGIELDARSQSWYRETGSGMGATLNVASGIGAYALTDRATWLKFANKGELTIIVEGHPVLFNQYGVIAVNPAKHSHVKTDEGNVFISWLVGDSGQRLINEYKIRGQQGFFANADS